MRQDAEPPSTEPSSRNELFMIGRNSKGNWVVRDESGLRGGLFIDRTAALRFALFENGRRPQAVLMVPGILELGLNQPANAPQQARTEVRSDLERKAA
jgi:hypothetical protein